MDNALTSVRVELVDLAHQVIAVGMFLKAFGMISETELNTTVQRLLTEQHKTLAEHMNMINYIMSLYNDKLVSLAKQSMSAKDLALSLPFSSTASQGV